MKVRYIDLVDQSFDWPQREFNLEDDQLLFHGVPLMDMVKKYGTPLRFSYLPKITQNIEQTKQWFKEAMGAVNYEADYHYCYCTKSSHFSFVMDRVLQSGVHLETSSSYDIDIIIELFKQGKIDKSKKVICNGFKTDDYVDKIAALIDLGFENVIPVIDNYQEWEVFRSRNKKPIQLGIRIASEEEPKFEFYTSRLGIGYKEIINFYKEKILPYGSNQLKMLHFFVNTGINDNAYYWNELTKCLRVYAELKKICPSLDSLNIGGGFPIKNSLVFDYDYQYMIKEIVTQIKSVCDEFEVPVPHIYTEFGSYTVGESGGIIYKILYQKKQNDREKWNMIDSSFMTTLPDTWAINKRFILLPLNKWTTEYERVFLGGLTCDSDDYYNSEQHVNGIYLPKYESDEPLYLGFFHTGAYQDSVGGFGGIHHCLIPSPAHILIDKDENGKISDELFAPRQAPEGMLETLGYTKPVQK